MVKCFVSREEQLFQRAENFCKNGNKTIVCLSGDGINVHFAYLRSTTHDKKGIW